MFASILSKITISLWSITMLSIASLAAIIIVEGDPNGGFETEHRQKKNVNNFISLIEDNTEENTSEDQELEDLLTIGDDLFDNIIPDENSPQQTIDINNIENINQITSEGKLPIISPDGLTPWRAYSRSFPITQGPKVIIIFVNAGYSDELIDKVLALDGKFTFVFPEHVPDLKSKIDKVFFAGHEAMLTIPMEPSTFPKDDPGPSALMSKNLPDTNIKKFHRILAKADSYVGVMPYMGDIFLTDPKLLTPIMEDLGQRGLIFFESKQSMISIAPKLANDYEIPHIIADTTIDESLIEVQIDQKLEDLTSLARQVGYAIGVAHIKPITVRRISLWLDRINSTNITATPITSYLGS